MTMTMVGNKENTPATPPLPRKEIGWLLERMKSRDHRVCFISSKTIRCAGMLMVVMVVMAVLVVGKDCSAKLGFDHCPISFSS